jgi:anaerobic selenocysteine-containing dehydrogenase
MSTAPESRYDKVVRTVCSPNCLGTCGVNAFVKDDRIVKLEPAAFPDPGFERICLRGIAMATQRIHHPDRLTHPLIRDGERGSGKWRTVSWDEAYDYIIERLNRNAAAHGWKSNAWLSGSGNYGFRAGTAAARVTNDLGGTQFTYFGICGDFAAMMGYHAALGSFGASNDISEVTGARYFLSVGKNVADTAHSDMHFLFDAMEGGTKFVMIDPRFTRSAAKADEWVPIKPGTDTALALGMIHVVIKERLYQEDYLRRHSNAPFLIDSATGRILRERDLTANGGNDALVWDEESKAPRRAAESVTCVLSGRWEITGADGRRLACTTAFSASVEAWQQYTPEYVSTICDVPAETIRHLAHQYATLEPAWIWLGLGAQRYSNGHLMARAWITLAALCGNIGKPYAGVGIYDAPNLAMVMTPHHKWFRPEGRRGHSLPGTRMVEIIASGEPYPVKALWLHAYGLATQSPLYKRFVAEALPKLDLFVVSEQVMTAAAAVADVVLPVVSYYEDDWDLVGGGENWYMQLRRRAVNPVGESRGDFDIFKGLCEKLGRGEAWQMDPEESCREILATHPDPRIRSVDWETLKRDGVARVEVERPYTPFRDMKFRTQSGRIELYQEQFVDVGEAILIYKERAEGSSNPKSVEFPLSLITYKHVHSTHSQHTQLPLIRELLPEPRLDISSSDADARDIHDGEPVTVFNERGRFTLKANVNNSVLPGTVALPQGFWQRDFPDGHPADLGHVPDNAAQSRIAEVNYPAWDIACEVRKA